MRNKKLCAYIKYNILRDRRNANIANRDNSGTKPTVVFSKVSRITLRSHPPSKLIDYNTRGFPILSLSLSFVLLFSLFPADMLLTRAISSVLSPYPFCPPPSRAPRGVLHTMGFMLAPIQSRVTIPLFCPASPFGGRSSSFFLALSFSTVLFRSAPHPL